MRILVALSLLAAVAVVPTASASCLAEIHGLCVRDPGMDPCSSFLSCELCFATVDACLYVEACLAGNVAACVDADTYCLHAWCPPPWA